jgi:N-acetylneuraminic acid mutarotase
VSRPPLGTPRGGLYSVDADGVIYAIGGFGTGFDPIHKSVEARDPATEQWTFVEPMSRPRGNQGAAYVEGQIYVVGGFDSQKSVTNTGESFDPSTNKWSKIRNRQRGKIAGPGATAFDGRVYLIGGGEPGGITDSVSIYDPTTDKWSHDARPMPTARMLLKAVTLDGQLYAVGGALGENLPFSSALERYDPIADSWTSLRPMTTGRGNPGVVAASGRITVVGGGGGVVGSGTALQSVEEYNPLTDVWTPSDPPLPVGRGSLSAEHGQGNTVLAIGGFEAGGASARVESRAI